MANEYFRRCTETNGDVLGTGRYHDGIKAIPVDSGILTVGGWDGLNSPNFTYNDQHSSNDYFATVSTLSNAPWNIRHSYGFDTDAAGDGWLFGSDKQPAATLTNRKELWKVNKATLAWTLINNALPTGDRVLAGFGIDKNTNKKYVFGGQVSYTLSDGTLGDIYEIAADGLSATQVQTGLAILQGNNDGHVCWDPVRSIFHLVCTGGKYDGTPSNKTYLKGHWTYNPSTNTITQLADFPGYGRQYGNLIWDYTDNVLLLVNGYAQQPGGGSAVNVAEVWYWNGNDWARKITRPYNSGTNKGTSHATALCWKAAKVAIIMGNENPTAWVYEKYEKLLS